MTPGAGSGRWSTRRQPCIRRLPPRWSCWRPSASSEWSLSRVRAGLPEGRSGSRRRPDPGEELAQAIQLVLDRALARLDRGAALLELLPAQRWQLRPEGDVGRETVMFASAGPHDVD